MLSALKEIFDVHVGFTFLSAGFGISIFVGAFTGHLNSRIGKLVYAFAVLISTVFMLLLILWIIAEPIFWAVEWIYRSI